MTPFDTFPPRSNLFPSQPGIPSLTEASRLIKTVPLLLFSAPFPKEKLKNVPSKERLRWKSIKIYKQNHALEKNIEFSLDNKV